MLNCFPITVFLAKRRMQSLILERKCLLNKWNTHSHVEKKKVDGTAGCHGDGPEGSWAPRMRQVSNKAWGLFRWIQHWCGRTSWLVIFISLWSSWMERPPFLKKKNILYLRCLHLNTALDSTTSRWGEYSTDHLFSSCSIIPAGVNTWPYEHSSVVCEQSVEWRGTIWISSRLVLLRLPQFWMLLVLD